MSVPAYLLGQAQESYHNVDAVDHPLELMKHIAIQALADAQITADKVDAVACIDPFSWTYADLARQVASGIGMQGDVREFWLPAGGTTPQDLIHEIALKMNNGELDVALLFGAEAMRTRRKATRAGQELPWPPRDKSINPMRGQDPMTSEWETQHGLRLPIQAYPLLENALRHAHGRTAQEQIDTAAGILHKNALVAANNPNAWFQDAPSTSLIGTVTEENRMISYPYTKRMNAIMDVDQAAAIVVVSARFVEDNGGLERAAAILGGAGSEDVWNPMQRPSLATSPGMEAAFSTALGFAQLEAADIAAFDFYSCFPSPVQMALSALGLSVDDERDFSITGGLGYAGGPGNNYVMHSLATAVARLRDNPDEMLMITGVGMANTKHAATILCRGDHVPRSSTGKTVIRVDTGEIAVDIAEKAAGPCTVVTYTIEYDRDAQPINVIYILDTEDGKRAVANARDPQAANERLLAADPIGKTGTLEWDADAERQYFEIR